MHDWISTIIHCEIMNSCDCYTCLTGRGSILSRCKRLHRADTWVSYCCYRHNRYRSSSGTGRGRGSCRTRRAGSCPRAWSGSGRRCWPCWRRTPSCCHSWAAWWRRPTAPADSDCWGTTAQRLWCTCSRRSESSARKASNRSAIAIWFDSDSACSSAPVCGQYIVDHVNLNTWDYAKCSPDPWRREHSWPVHW